ncbi:MAG: hercynine metabolism small protein [Synechococcaceae cyanobacterium]|nr:hercynine metabolism small protein [Synechococcaceae cyanobacterium]
MSREEQRQAMRRTREGLIAELEELYRRAFDRISEQDLGEGAIARLTQLLLRSREAAITPLQEEIEAPLITRAPGTPLPESPAAAGETP